MSRFLSLAAGLLVVSCRSLDGGFVYDEPSDETSRSQVRFQDVLHDTSSDASTAGSSDADFAIRPSSQFDFHLRNSEASANARTGFTGLTWGELGWIAAGLLAIAAGYVLGRGPAEYAVMRGWLSCRMIDAIYGPLDRALPRYAGPFHCRLVPSLWRLRVYRDLSTRGRPYHRYVDWWASRGFHARTVRSNRQPASMASYMQTPVERHTVG